MQHEIELVTPRLILKSITPSFITETFKSKTESEIKSNFGVDDSGYNHLVDMNEKGMETHRISLFYFILVNKETNAIIGECGFHTWNKTHQRAELFYHLKDEQYKRQRLMTEALSVILSFGFNQLQLNRIEALTAQWNEASNNILLKFGFIKEGTMREDYVYNGKNEDSVCYSLLKREWKQKE